MVCPTSWHWPELDLGGDRCQVNLGLLTSRPWQKINDLIQNKCWPLCHKTQVWPATSAVQKHTVFICKATDQIMRLLVNVSSRQRIHQKRRVLRAEAAVLIQPWIRRRCLPPAARLDPCAVLPAKLYFSFPNRRWRCCGSRSRRADSRSLAPLRQHPDSAGMANPPLRDLAKHQGLLSRSQGRFETIPLRCFPLPTSIPQLLRVSVGSGWEPLCHVAASQIFAGVTAMLCCGLSQCPQLH